MEKALYSMPNNIMRFSCKPRMLQLGLVLSQWNASIQGETHHNHIYIYYRRLFDFSSPGDSLVHVRHH